MKHKIKRRLSFLNLAKLAIAPSIAPILLALMLVTLLSLAPAAYAADYNGNCADVPASVDGNAIISDSACTIDKSVTATGTISLNASGPVTIQGLSGNAVTVTSTSGAITTQVVTASNGTLTITSMSGAITTLTINRAGHRGKSLLG